MKQIVLTALLSFIWSCIATPQVVPAAVFQSHMVLQQDMPIRVWGTSSAGERIHASLDGEVQDVTATKNGIWEVVFNPRRADFNPVNLVINNHIFSDILIGEVWICSGQSNMAWPVRKSDIPDQKGITGNPALRYLKLVGPRAVAKESYTGEELGRCNTRDFFKGGWKSSTEESIPLFSAVGWLFGQNLTESMNVPVGIIEVAVGGSAINNWLPKRITKNHPYTSHLYQGNWLTNPRVLPNHQKRARDAFKHVLTEDEPYIPGEMNYRWMCEPSFLYEAAIEPIRSLSIRGVVWYQGESDAHREEPAIQYGELFKLFIESLREDFGNKHLPVLYVQLPGYKVDAWPLFREQQRQAALNIPDLYMAVTIDLGLADNIHPMDKSPVGDRLSSLALKYVYKKNRIPGFPGLKRIIAKPDGLVLTYSNTGKGLRSCERSVPHFEIAGTDSTFVPAEAMVISRKKVLVKTGNNRPTYIRYGWLPYPDPPIGLFNSDQLPVGPFIKKTGMNDN